MQKNQLSRCLTMIVGVIGAGLGGCGDNASDHIEIDGLPYAFPRADLEKFVMPKDGMIYVRLNDSSSNYILILDSMVDRAERQRGHPVIATLNFGRYAKTETVETVGGSVICRDRPGLNCGVRIDDSGIRWSVIFDRSDIKKVDSIKRSALRKIQSYRED